MFFTAVKGNLVANGGFETGTVGAPPPEWQSSNVAIVGATLAHTGAQAASLGQVTPSDPAMLFQDIPVIPGRRYQLTFAWGVNGTAAGDLAVSGIWLSATGLEIGQGLYVFISGVPSPAPAAGFYVTVTALTDTVPAEAAFCRLLFTRSPSLTATDPTVIDDVTFADLN
ncbi:MAG: hypothetical protein IMW97_07650 [Firmicutes bacterium]|nr:hypothetical protein [Candidatus Fermentithermobacillaceae bacterium]